MAAASPPGWVSGLGTAGPFGDQGRQHPHVHERRRVPRRPVDPGVTLRSAGRSRSRFTEVKALDTAEDGSSSALPLCTQGAGNRRGRRSVTGTKRSVRDHREGDDLVGDPDQRAGTKARVGGDGVRDQRQAGRLDRVRARRVSSRACQSVLKQIVRLRWETTNTAKTSTQDSLRQSLPCTLAHSERAEPGAHWFSGAELLDRSRSGRRSRAGRWERSARWTAS